jgi:hypothetical protein
MFLISGVIASSATFGLSTSGNKAFALLTRLPLALISAANDRTSVMPSTAERKSRLRLA